MLKILSLFVRWFWIFSPLCVDPIVPTLDTMAWPPRVSGRIPHRHGTFPYSSSHLPPPNTEIPFVLLLSSGTPGPSVS